MLSQSTAILGEIFDRLDDGVLVLSNVDRRYRVIYHNAQYKELWAGTYALQARGTDYTYPHGDSINKAIHDSRTYQKTIQVNNGSVPRFFYLKFFPANANHYIEISRDITETYVRHNRDREYKSLFLTLFEKSILPTALINTRGFVTMANPEMYLDLSDRRTISAVGSPVWSLFPERQYELKERFEQLVSGSNRDFEMNNYIFFGVRNTVSDPDFVDAVDDSVIWVLMKKGLPRITVTSPATPPEAIEKTEGLDPEIDQLKELVRTWHAVIRLVTWLQGLPWGIIGAIVLSASGGGWWFLQNNQTPPPQQQQGQGQ